MAVAGVNTVSKCRNNKSYDRFIPYRPSLDVDAAYARIRASWANAGKEEPAQYVSANTRKYWKLLEEAGHRQNGKILPIGSNACDKNGACPRLRTEFSTLPSPEKQYGVATSPKYRRATRVPTSPERIMDMPGLQDDYYTNSLDWSRSNLLAVALNQTTYVWFVDSMRYRKVEPLGHQERYYISALSWSPTEPLLAIADNDGDITVYNCEINSCHKTRSRDRLSSSIGVIQWTEYGIISGNANGVITVSDTRVSQDNTSTVAKVKVNTKSSEIIGLRQAPNSPYLASGSEDGVVNIWDLRMYSVCSTIEAHSACAKALSWCPYRSGVLATGGGVMDGYIRLWQAHTGEKLGEVFTQSQICGLLWSNDYRELVSAHGSAVPDKNDLVLWSMRSLEFEPVSVLRQHLARPLHIALSPDETTLASVGADEALCLWKAFPKKCRRPVWNKSALDLFKTIR